MRISIIMLLISIIYFTNSSSIDELPHNGEGIEKAETELKVSDIIKKYRTAVVRIDIYEEYKTRPSGGTGSIITKDGYIITCSHLFETAYPIKEIKVVRVDDNGSELEPHIPGERVNIEGKMKNLLEGKDIALLKIKGRNLPTVKLMNSQDARVGDKLVSIGYPEGSLIQEFMEGVLIAINIKNKESSLPTFRTSFPFVFGYSGGPIFNLKGEVIAVAESVLMRPDISPQGFVIPINFFYPFLRTINLEIPEPKKDKIEGLIKIKRHHRSCIWQLGKDDQSPTEFNHSEYIRDSKRGFNSFNISTDKISSFPGFINNKDKNLIKIDFEVKKEDIKEEMVLVLDSVGGFYGDFSLGVFIKNSDRREYYAGTYTFDAGAGGNLFPKRHDVTIKNDWIKPGENSIILKSENPIKSERKLYWDYLELMKMDGDSRSYSER